MDILSLSLSFCLHRPNTCSMQLCIELHRVWGLLPGLGHRWTHQSAGCKAYDALCRDIFQFSDPSTVHARLLHGIRRIHDQGPHSKCCILGAMLVRHKCISRECVANVTNVANFPVPRRRLISQKCKPQKLHRKSSASSIVFSR